MKVTKQDIASLLSDFSIEVTPASAQKVNSFVDYLPPNTSINVTFLPGSNIDDTVNVSRRLYKEGFKPVPHLAARNFKNQKSLEQCLEQLTTLANVEEVLVIGGGLNAALGPYHSSMQILDSGLLEKYSIKKVGIAGHPEGSPDISDLEVEQALHDKNSWARSSNIKVYIATQFCFEATTIIDWENRINKKGNTLPIHIGLPGLATLKTLLKFAQLSGIGPSMRVLTRQTKNLAKLVMNQEPDIVVSELASYVKSNPDSLIKQVHFYPFGGLGKTASWVNSVIKGEITLKSNKGFNINTSN
jgi:methylenetetrahydrofolate reductase (NADPH)